MAQLALKAVATAKGGGETIEGRGHAEEDGGSE
jgi:hypothetical protein